jgi:hypothetical protein
MTCGVDDGQSGSDPRFRRISTKRASVEWSGHVPGGRRADSYSGMRSEKFSNSAKSGYNKGTIRTDIRYLEVSKDVRRHRLISINYIKTLSVTAEVASSSLIVPAIPLKNLPKVLHFRVGTKRHKIGTGNRVFPSRAYVSGFFLGTRARPLSPARFAFPL